MTRIWSREHFVRRVDRYYLLAATAKLPRIRRQYLHLARLYRTLLSARLAPVA